MKIYGNLIGHREAGTTIPFSGSDNYENLTKRLKTEPADWYYRSANISYCFNSFGHRCKEPNEVDFDNYILAVGCSHTEGVGLELEKAYPHQLSSMLGCDYYSLGIGGTGIDVMIHNLTLWLNTYKRPKALVIQWPDRSRYLTFAEDNEHEIGSKDFMLTPHGASWSKGIPLAMVLMGERSLYFKTRRALAKIKIDSFNIPTIHLAPSQYDGTFPLDAMPLLRLDEARDKHYGIESHKAVALQMQTILTSKYNF